jgi:type VI protein secretion system component VasA
MQQAVLSVLLTVHRSQLYPAAATATAVAATAIAVAVAVMFVCALQTSFAQSCSKRLSWKLLEQLAFCQ